MLLSNFLIQWSWNILNENNILMMLNKCLIQWFWVDVTTKPRKIYVTSYFLINHVSDRSAVFFWFKSKSESNLQQNVSIVSFIEKKSDRKLFVSMVGAKRTHACFIGPFSNNPIM